jgi:MerR HTH family regulatory protein
MVTAADSQVETGTSLAQLQVGLVSIDGLAHRAGLHPDLVRGLIALGLINPGGGTRAAPLFRAQDASLLAKAVRLRRDLGLNYTGAVLACELLARIDDLEERLRRAVPPEPHHEVITWTRIV